MYDPEGGVDPWRCAAYDRKCTMRYRDWASARTHMMKRCQFKDLFKTMEGTKTANALKRKSEDSNSNTQNNKHMHLQLRAHSSSHSNFSMDASSYSQNDFSSLSSSTNSSMFNLSSHTTSSMTSFSSYNDDLAGVYQPTDAEIAFYNSLQVTSEGDQGLNFSGPSQDSKNMLMFNDMQQDNQPFDGRS